MNTETNIPTPSKWMLRFLIALIVLMPTVALFVGPARNAGAAEVSIGTAKVERARKVVVYSACKVQANTDTYCKLVKPIKVDGINRRVRITHVTHVDGHAVWGFTAGRNHVRLYGVRVVAWADSDGSVRKANGSRWCVASGTCHDGVVSGERVLPVLYRGLIKRHFDWAWADGVFTGTWTVLQAN